MAIDRSRILAERQVNRYCAENERPPIQGNGGSAPSLKPDGTDLGDGRRVFDTGSEPNGYHGGNGINGQSPRTALAVPRMNLLPPKYRQDSKVSEGAGSDIPNPEPLREPRQLSVFHGFRQMTFRTARRLYDAMPFKKPDLDFICQEAASGRVGKYKEYYREKLMSFRVPPIEDLIKKYGAGIISKPLSNGQCMVEIAVNSNNANALETMNEMAHGPLREVLESAGSRMINGDLQEKLDVIRYLNETFDDLHNLKPTYDSFQNAIVCTIKNADGSSLAKTLELRYELGVGPGRLTPGESVRAESILHDAILYRIERTEDLDPLLAIRLGLRGADTPIFAELLTDEREAAKNLLLANVRACIARHDYPKLQGIEKYQQKYGLSIAPFTGAESAQVKATLHHDVLRRSQNYVAGYGRGQELCDNLSEVLAARGKLDLGPATLTADEITSIEIYAQKAANNGSEVALDNFQSLQSGFYTNGHEQKTDVSASNGNGRVHAVAEPVELAEAIAGTNNGRTPWTGYANIDGTEELHFDPSILNMGVAPAKAEAFLPYWTDVPTNNGNGRVHSGEKDEAMAAITEQLETILAQQGRLFAQQARLLNTVAAQTAATPVSPGVQFTITMSENVPTAHISQEIPSMPVIKHQAITSAKRHEMKQQLAEVLNAPPEKITEAVENLLASGFNPNIVLNKKAGLNAIGHAIAMGRIDVAEAIEKAVMGRVDVARGIVEASRPFKGVRLKTNMRHFVRDGNAQAAEALIGFANTAYRRRAFRDAIRNTTGIAITEQQQADLLSRLT